MDFALADSVLHFNDGKRGHMLLHLAGGDWMLASLFTFIIRRTTPAGYVPALKRTRKAKKKD